MLATQISAEDELRSLQTKKAISKINFAKKKAISLANLPANRPTSDDLVPGKNKYHKLGGLDVYLWTIFDDYALEYGKYFQDRLKEFEEQFNLLKRDI